MAEFASRAVGNTGLGLAIGSLGAQVLNGGLNGLLGGAGCGNQCGANAYQTRYDAEKDARIAALETEVKLRDANFYTVSEMGKLRDYVDGKFEKVECRLGEQAAYNAANNATLGCISGQIQQLYGLTKLVVPNSSVCPGYGDVTITPATATTTAG